MDQDLARQNVGTVWTHTSCNPYRCNVERYFSGQLLGDKEHPASKNVNVSKQTKVRFTNRNMEYQRFDFRLNK